MRRTLTLVFVVTAALGAVADTDVDLTKAALPDGQVDIENVAGSVEVIGWDRPEIRVHGTLGEDVERLKFDVVDRRTEVKVIVPKRKKRHIESYLTIHVPQGSRLDVETVSAGIDVDNVQGDQLDIESVSGRIDMDNVQGDQLNIESVSGRVRVAQTRGEIDAESVSGSITLSDTRGPVNVETVSGKVVVSGTPPSVDAQSVSGRIEIEGVTESIETETVSGRVNVTSGTLEKCRMESVSGALEFAGALRAHGKLAANTISGSVTLAFTEPVSGAFDVRSFSGRIECDFGPSAVRTSKWGPGSELRFSTPDGTARVSVETFTGSVRIR